MNIEALATSPIPLLISTGSESPELERAAAQELARRVHAGSVDRGELDVTPRGAVELEPREFGLGAESRDQPLVFSQTETWEVLSAVKGVRSQSLHRSRSVRPAMRAMRSYSAGHAYRCEDSNVSARPLQK